MNNLSGEIRRGSKCLLDFPANSENLAGELPLSLIKMKAEGVEVYLNDNKGFTLPENVGDLTEITELDLSISSLTGALRTGTNCLIF